MPKAKSLLMHAAFKIKVSASGAEPKLPAYPPDGPPDPDLIRIRDLIYDVAGIFHPDTKLRLLFERCGRRMKYLHMASFLEYRNCLTLGLQRQSEMIALLNEITIGETSFFRNQPQLEALREVVIPGILAQKKDTPLRRLRIWSAGCSTGEEPYTLAMLMLEDANRQLQDWTVEILATDLNEVSLTHARAGLYNAYSTRYLSQHYREKYFTPVIEKWQLAERVRSRVTFKRLNLSEHLPTALLHDVDIVFCCNVLIYFDLASKRRVVDRFHHSLVPYGYLFLGHSESLYGVTDNFHLVHLPGSTAYVKVDREAPGKEKLVR
jgi:chemotaxis protein methyltransferase CheR